MSLATSNIFSALDTKKKKKANRHAQDTSERKKEPTIPKKYVFHRCLRADGHAASLTAFKIQI